MACPPCPVEEFIRPLAHSIVSARPGADPISSIPSEYFGAPAVTSVGLTTTGVPSMNTRFLPWPRRPAYSPPVAAPPPAGTFVPSPSKQQPLMMMMTGDRQAVPAAEEL